MHVFGMACISCHGSILMCINYCLTVQHRQNNVCDLVWTLFIESYVSSLFSTLEDNFPTDFVFQHWKSVIWCRSSSFAGHHLHKVQYVLSVITTKVLAVSVHRVTTASVALFRYLYTHILLLTFGMHCKVHMLLKKICRHVPHRCML